MSRILRYGFLVIGLAFLFSSVSPAEAKAQNVLGDILRRMDINNKTLQSLRAEVTMVKFNPQLNVSDILAGTTSYLPKTAKRGMYVRIDWRTENGRPMEESISVIGDDYELYRKRVNQVITGKVGKSRNNASVGGALGFMSMSKEQLKQNYTVQFIANEQIKGETLTAHLLLTPKSPTTYKTADLWVDVNGLPVQAKITEQNNDSTTVLLENVRKNETLNAGIFKLQYPGTAKKIKA